MRKVIGKYVIDEALPGRYVVCHAKTGRTVSAYTYSTMEDAESYIRDGCADEFVKKFWSKRGWKVE